MSASLRPFPLANNDVVRTTSFMQQNTQVAQVDLTWIMANVVGNPTSQALLTTIDGILAPAFKGMMRTSSNYYGTKARKLKPANNVLPDGFSGNTGAGTQTGDSLPTQVCGLMTIITLLIGRKGRGRIYIPFPTEDFNATTGEPTAPYIALISALGTALCASPAFGGGGNTGQATLVITNAAGVVNAVAVDGVGSDKFATQRRRGDYGRPGAWPPF